ncbi:MAG: hypothetical protein NC124_05305 [Clostridium sp.]|nr:hypothetical protein [Clostridium sp.]
MNSATGDFYNIATAVAAEGFLKSVNGDRDSHLRELLDSKDEVDGQRVMDRMDDFSCREEMERFVEKCASED